MTCIVLLDDKPACAALSAAPHRFRSRFPGLGEVAFFPIRSKGSGHASSLVTLSGKLFYEFLRQLLAKSQNRFEEIACFLQAIDRCFGCESKTLLIVLFDGGFQFLPFDRY